MSTSVSLSTIQANHIISLCKLCSNALVLVDTITLEWFRVTNIIGHLFCSINRPTIEQINDQVNRSKFYLTLFFFFQIYFLLKNLFDNNQRSHLVIILSQSMTMSRLNEICAKRNFESITLLLSSPLIIDDDKNELLSNGLQIKQLQFPFISITDSVFLIPTLIPYRLPPIDTLISISNEKLKVN